MFFDVNRLAALDARLDALAAVVRLGYLIAREGGWGAVAEWGESLSLGAPAGVLNQLCCICADCQGSGAYWAGPGALVQMHMGPHNELSQYLPFHAMCGISAATSSKHILVFA